MVKVCNDNSILFKGMSGEVLNVWVSHHEGQINVPVHDEPLVVLRYVDQKGEETDKYPWNPNGSIGGVTGICDETGRHFGLMPHLERSFLNWQMPYGGGEGNYTGWFKCVLNAYKWCIGE
jgi:phosphoribosylformylglycinamidine synthase